MVEIHHRQEPRMGAKYTAHDEDGNVIGWVLYAKDFPKPGTIIIHELVVEPEHQFEGVAVELLRKLHQTNPTYKINPGQPSPDGLDFIRRIWESEPEVEGAAEFFDGIKEQLWPS